MISIILGGAVGDREFDSWINLNCKHVYRLSPFKKGDFAKFAAAVTESRNHIVSKNYLGAEVDRIRANDPILVHISEEELKNLSLEEILTKTRAYVYLAEDAELEFKVCAYSSQIGGELVKVITGEE